MDTVLKFRTTMTQKRALERAARQFGSTTSTLLRRAAEIAQQGRLTPPDELDDFRQVRELANAAMAALGSSDTSANAAPRVREAVANIHRIANSRLRVVR